MRLKKDYSTGGAISRALDEIIRREGLKDIDELCERHGFKSSIVKSLCIHEYQSVEMIGKICRACGISADNLLGLAVDL
jgi:hypothetical protein